LWKNARLGEPLSRTDEIAIVGLTFVFAYLSWKFVEQPARNPKARRPVVLGLVGAGFGTLMAASLAIASLGAMPGRLSPEAVKLAATLDYDPAIAFRSGTCFLELEQDLDSFDQETCLHSEPGQKNYLLLGDSHAAHLY